MHRNSHRVILASALALCGLTTGCRLSGPELQFGIRMELGLEGPKPRNWSHIKDLGWRTAPRVGQPAPDFTLRTLDGAEVITRSDFQAGRPLVLVFGSFTWPPFRCRSGDIEALFRKYQDRAAFLLVYIREAHAADGWSLDENARAGIDPVDPTDWDARRDLAGRCCGSLGLSLPCVVDTIDNTVDELYAGFPERMFVIDGSGTIAYAGKMGPWGFKPEDAEAALLKLPLRAAALEPFPSGLAAFDK